jgi:phosphoribosylamine--glycine ligase
MKTLIIGSGGREHALAWKLAQSPSVSEIVCAPGNPGIGALGKCVPVDVEDIAALVALVRQEKPDLVVVGPERPLIRGVVDELRALGVPVFGPTRSAARLEGSKAFTNELLQRHGISRKRFAVFTEREAAHAYIRQQGAPIVVKADGDAFGKGVKVASTVEEACEFVDRCMVAREFGASGERVVVEECLVGQECSIIALTDGKTVLPLVPSQDHKRIGEGDTGDNTGGMGCYSPVPAVTDEVFHTCLEGFLRPTVEAMAAEGHPYTGALYGGMILPESGVELLEYNCRFGDPETQVIVPRMEGDFAAALLATAEGRLAEASLSASPHACVCVVMASGGYPGSYEKGKSITGIEAAEKDPQVVVFHAGTALRDGQLVTAGGRVLGVTAWGADFREALDRAYEAVRAIEFEGAYYRRDIGWRALAADTAPQPRP